MAAPLRAVDAVRVPLAAMAGTEGFRLLLSRALTLAKPAAPVLAALQIAADGSVTGVEDIPPSRREEATEGGVLLVAQLLTLLIEFIGEPLTLRLLASASSKPTREQPPAEKEISL